MPNKKRIVVTGLGIVSSLGCDIETVWSRLVSGASGIKKLQDKSYEGISSRVAGSVPSISDDACGLDIGKLISLKDQRKMDRFIQFSLEAANQAITQAEWFPKTEEQKERTATIIASSLGGFLGTAKAVENYNSFGPHKMSPFTIPSFLTNLAAGQVSMRYGFKGPMGSPVSACAASTQAIGDGMRMLLNDEIDVAVCGGAEACIDPVILSSFCSLGAVSTQFNDTPSEASRPFSKNRDGFVLGEGAAIVILETLEHAQNRGATPLAELVGYATSSDAYHVTACLENGEGLQRAMHFALKMANLKPDAIGYLNAHASSTPSGDKSEARAIREVFKTHSNVSISATKSATGHLLGATGGVEAIFSILALRDGILPPTLNFSEPDPITDGLDIVGLTSVKKEIEYAMSNNTGFGGVNASLIFKKWNSGYCHA